MVRKIEDNEEAAPGGHWRGRCALHRCVRSFSCSEHMMIFVDWEYRPAIVTSGFPRRAWAVLGPGEDWEEIDPDETAYDRLLPSEAAMRERFLPEYGQLPPVPDAALMADQSSPDSLTAAE
ncbi:hypothetical protein MWN34_03350 [Ancylobacter sp. 6x-1]|uniref:Uncharacterized protein n=1 Tax=Ancylobacter crimeensis TaxID=2579147 RepID=A0ABT0D7N0_9HYPH|nr:hypothetical protein [Ancylobacter crimeensis]MCK0195941.1 hypothetical protein [Ancylobacter crimeensis]